MVEGSASELDKVCSHQAEAQLHYENDIPDEESNNVLNSIQEKVCPNQCNNKGACVEGKCTCDAGKLLNIICVKVINSIHYTVD